MIRLFMLMTLAASLAFGAEAEKDKPAQKSDSGETVQTPFGPVKKQAAQPKPEPRPVASKPLVDISLDGDTYTFTRQTPFGAQSWKRAKADLSSDEKKLIEQQEAWEKQEAEKPKPEPAAAEKPQT
jgi:hypothetical protein